MNVDRELVDYVAGLAKLRLDDDERRRLVEQLDRIVRYVEQLRDVDVDDVPPTKHVLDAVGVTRDDTPGESLPRDRALANAPQVADGYFVVPRVIPGVDTAGEAPDEGHGAKLQAAPDPPTEPGQETEPEQETEPGQDDEAGQDDRA